VQLRDAAQTLGVHYQTAYGWVREGTLAARKTPRGYEVRDSDWTAQASGLYDAIVAGDEKRARLLFGRLAPGVPLTGICDLVIAPALGRIGTEWAAGKPTVVSGCGLGVLQYVDNRHDGGECLGSFGCAFGRVRQFDPDAVLGDRHGCYGEFVVIEG
jgi:hypothetical protein